MSLPRLILVVVDPDLRQTAATDRAIDLALRSGARLHLLLPVFDPRIDATAELVDPGVERNARQALVARCHRWLAEWTEKLISQQMRVTCEVVWARLAHEAVVVAALAMAPDLVIKDLVHSPVLHGRTAISSSDWRLARRCPFALMLVQQRSTTGPCRVAVAVDPGRSQLNESGLDERVMQSALPLALLLDGSLELIHVFPSLQANREPAPALDDVVARLQRNDVEAFTRFAKRHRVPAERCTLLIGEPVHAILQHVEDRGIGLLVIGSQYWEGLDGLSLGSNAEALFAHAECDLLLVRPQGFAANVANASARVPGAIGLQVGAGGCPAAMG